MQYCKGLHNSLERADEQWAKICEEVGQSRAPMPRRDLRGQSRAPMPRRDLRGMVQQQAPAAAASNNSGNEKREKRYKQFENREDETYPYSEAADAVLKYLMGPKQPGDQARDDARQKEFKDAVDKLNDEEVTTVARVFAGGRRVGGQSDAMLRDKILGKRKWAKRKYDDRKYVQAAKKAKMAK